MLYLLILNRLLLNFLLVRLSIVLFDVNKVLPLLAHELGGRDVLRGDAICVSELL